MPFHTELPLPVRRGFKQQHNWDFCMREESIRAVLIHGKAAFGELHPRGRQPFFNLFIDLNFRRLTRQSRVPIAQKGK